VLLNTLLQVPGLFATLPLRFLTAAGALGVLFAVALLREQEPEPLMVPIGARQSAGAGLLPPHDARAA